MGRIHGRRRADDDRGDEMTYYTTVTTHRDDGYSTTYGGAITAPSKAEALIIHGVNITIVINYFLTERQARFYAEHADKRRTA